MHKKTPLATAIAIALLMAAAPAFTAEPTATDQAQTQASKPAPVINIEALEALDKMGAALRSLQRFEIDSTSTIDLVLLDGQKLQLNHQSQLQVVRPDKLHAKVVSSRGQREFFYDGKKASLYNAGTKYYATVDAPPTIAKLIEEMHKTYGVSMPLADLFYWEHPDSSKIQSALVAGTDIIDGALCDHYLFRQADVDWQLWIERGKTPLPRKLVIINTADEALPQYTVEMKWKLSPKLPASLFTFKPAKTDNPITILKLQVTEITTQ